MDIVTYILAWSTLAAGITYGVRILFLASDDERFARGVYRDRTPR